LDTHDIYEHEVVEVDRDQLFEDMRVFAGITAYGSIESDAGKAKLEVLSLAINSGASVHGVYTAATALDTEDKDTVELNYFSPDGFYALPKDEQQILEMYLAQMLLLEAFKDHEG